MKKRKLLLGLFWMLCATSSYAQSPVVKLDIDMSGRTTAEVTNPGYTAWVPDNAVSTTKTVSGVTFTMKKTGSNGTALKADWYKAGVQAPSYARLECDGLIVENGNAGAEIELTINGLSTGTHSLLTFHNSFASPDAYTFAPIDVYVNGSLKINNLAPSNRALNAATVASSYITFSATTGKSTVILFKAETSSSATMKNVYINGFELNTPNVKDQSKNPNPSDINEHVGLNSGGYTLSWEAGNNATQHRIYFGTDQSCVANGTTSSACYKGQQAGTTYAVAGLNSMSRYYWRVDEVSSTGVVTKGNVWYFRPSQLAFPGAEGYGRFAIGGRGGKVIHVTNLNDSGAGSLRDAVENQSGPRTIVFDVGGIITLKSRLVLSDPYVTVAGQTAPGNGICVRSAPFGFTGNELIVRHIRVRLGAGPTYDGMGMTGANNSILDHCSVSWTIDEAFSSRGGKNITLQRTLISEALNAAGHQNYPAGTEHGYAATIGGDIGSFHHNLLAHCYGRNWSMGGGLDGNGYYSGRLDITNNVVYNWGSRATDGGAKEVTFVNNYYKPGAGTTQFYALSVDHEGTGLGMQRAYFSGNVMPGKFNESNQSSGRRTTYSNGDKETYATFVSAPFFPSNITTQTAYDAYKSVLSDVGATQPFFDNHDVRIINETLNGTYTYKGSVTGKPGFPDHQNDVGGYENYPTTNRASNWDSDGDGMPDFWESAIGTNPSSGAGNFSESNADPDNNGYTRLEEYLNWMAEPHLILSNVSSQTINLTNLFKGYSKTSPVYTSSAVNNGSVSILGSNATFTKANCGLASFRITVKDSENATFTRTIGVVVSGSCGNNTAPVINLTAPANNATYTAPAGINITANATDADGTITNVQFYNGSTLLGSDVSSPYSFSWTNVAEGTYTISARATDNAGTITTSAAITVKVNAAPVNVAPTVSISAPVNNASYNAPATIAINANAADSDGTIATVQFYNGNTLLGSDASSPYSFSWTNVAAGTYTITAKATDNEGAVTTSAAIAIKVNTISTADIIGPDCSKNGSSITFELNSGKRANATSYNWWYTGSAQSTSFSASTPYMATIQTGSSFSSGQVCVGVNYSVSPWYTSYCKTITICNARTGEVEEIEEPNHSLLYPNPSQSEFVFVPKTDLSSLKIINGSGEIIYTLGSVEQGTTLTLGAQWTAGVYMLSATYTNGTQETQKLIKVK